MASSSTTRPGAPGNMPGGNVPVKKKKKKLPPSAPYIAFGAAWAVYAMTFNFYKLWHMIPAALFSLIIGFVFACLSEKPAPRPAPEPAKDRGQEQAAELDKLTSQLRGVAATINDPFVKDYAVSICGIAEKIADNVDLNPSDNRRSRTFTKHYFPTVISVFERYSTLEKQGVSGGNISASMAEIIDSLDHIEEMFKKQLDDMFSDDAIDIKTDLDVLASIMKSDVK